MDAVVPARLRPAVFLRAAGRLLLLGPRAVADGVAVLRGRADNAITRQRTLAGEGVGAAAGPTGGRQALAHALLSAVLWVPALVLLGVLVLAVARGLLYGLVVDGPYTDAWGGPTFAGAWAVHALVSLPALAVVGLGVLGLAALHTRITNRLLGGRGPRWSIPIALLVGATGLLLVIAWSQQI